MASELLLSYRQEGLASLVGGSLGFVVSRYCGPTVDVRVARILCVGLGATSLFILQHERRLQAERAQQHTVLLADWNRRCGRVDDDEPAENR